MSASLLIVALVTVQRACELAWGQRNAAALLARGGIEAGRGHHWPLVGLHAAWLAGLWLLAWDSAVDPAWLAFYLLLQFARAWVLWTLGRRWTTRVIVLPSAPLVRSGPYRYLRHPNYVVLAAEVAVLPLVFGLWWYALVFSALNALLLAIRIRAEDRALCAGAPVKEP